MGEDIKLVAEFMNCKVEYDVADWTEYNDESLIEHWNNNDLSFVYIPKGQGRPWYKVIHRDIFYQLYTDFTFNKLKEEDIPLGCTYNNEYYLLDDLKFHQSWDWLMPVCIKCKTVNPDFFSGSGILKGLIQMDIKLTFESVVKFIRKYNTYYGQVQKTLHITRSQNWFEIQL